MELWKITIKLVFCLVFLTSCENPVSNMKETAEQAADNSGRAADAATESREEIANGRLMSRMSGSSESRENHFEKMQESESFDAKALAAGKWMKALEFMHWTGQKYDTQEVLEAMYDEAFTEFFRKLPELINGKSLARNPQSPFYILGGAKDRAYNVYAMAVTLHKKASNLEFTTWKRVEGFEPKSFYDVMKEGLEKIQRVEDGELAYGELKTWEQTLYTYRDDAIAVLNHRATMLLTMSLVKLTDLKEKNQFTALYNLNLSRNIKSRFPELGLGVQHTVNSYLEGAFKTIRVLKSINETPDLHPKVKTMYKKLVMPKTLKAADGVIQEHLSFIKQIFPDIDIKTEK